MAKVFYYMVRIDARKKCLKNLSVIISEYPETISVMMNLTVF